jgi:predicted nucleotidyltransferase
MITTDERNLVRKRLLELAAADPVVTAAAITGSYVGGGGDEWSDIDLAFAIRGELAPALEHWTELLDRDFGALHHWDLPFASTVYRVFLLPEGLEVDIAFTPEADFGPRGPNWRTVFGETVQLPPGAPPDRDELIGRAWHHVLHARACIERRKPWQAEYLISAIRDQVLALACLRLGYTTMYAKGADRLPAELTAPLEATLVRSLDEAEMRRALAAAAGALVPELDQTDPVLAARLRPVLEEVASIVGRAQTDLPSSSLTMPRCTIRKLDRDDAQEWTLLRRQALETHPLAFGASIPDDPQLLVQFILPRLTSSELWCVHRWLSHWNRGDRSKRRRERTAQSLHLGDVRLRAGTTKRGR